MYFGNNVVGTCNVVMNVGNDAVCVRDVVTNVGNLYVRFDRKLSLKKGGQQWRGGIGRTHVKDMKDPVEVQPPGGNRVFIALGVEKARNYVALALLQDLPLDLRHGPTITCAVGQPSKLRTVGSTHVVNWFMASDTDRPRSSSFFPFVPRSRALQISAQFSPSST